MKIAKDPLLGMANALLLFFVAVLGLAATAMLLTAPAVLIFQHRIVATFANEGVAGAERMFPALSPILLSLAGLLSLGVYFLILLRRIVRSVGEGDPFVPVNAVRLARMGWTVLAGELLSIPVGAAVVWIANMVEDRDHVSAGDDFGPSGTGLLLVLVLFILARVFRQGAAMRDELEGTV
jgi:hypothetical protein